MDHGQTERDLPWERYAGLGGIAFGIVISVLFVLDSTPADDAPAADWLAYMTEDTGTKVVYALAFGIALLAFLWCFGSVRSILARAEGGTYRLSTVAFGAAVLAIALMAGSGALTWSNAIAEDFLGAFEADVQTGLALLGAGAILFVYAVIAAGVALGAAGIVMLRKRVFPRWFAWASVISGLVLLTGGIFDFTFLLLVLWAIAVGVLVLGGMTGAPRSA